MIGGAAPAAGYAERSVTYAAGEPDRKDMMTSLGTTRSWGPSGLPCPEFLRCSASSPARVPRLNGLSLSGSHHLYDPVPLLDVTTRRGSPPAVRGAISGVQSAAASPSSLSASSAGGVVAWQAARGRVFSRRLLRCRALALRGASRVHVPLVGWASCSSKRHRTTRCSRRLGAPSLELGLSFIGCAPPAAERGR